MSLFEKLTFRSHAVVMRLGFASMHLVACKQLPGQVHFLFTSKLRYLLVNLANAHYIGQQNAPKAFYTYWTKFLPDSPDRDRPASLFTILSSDPTDNVRIAACNTLVTILDGSKPYLSVAADRYELTPRFSPCLSSDAPTHELLWDFSL